MSQRLDCTTGWEVGFCGSMWKARYSCRSSCGLLVWAEDNGLARRICADEEADERGGKDDEMWKIRYSCRSLCGLLARAEDDELVRRICCGQGTRRTGRERRRIVRRTNRDAST